MLYKIYYKKLERTNKTHVFYGVTEKVACYCLSYILHFFRSELPTS